MTEQEIYNLLRNGERVTQECKRATNAVPNSVWETYSAFANTYGGVILLGVHEDLKEKEQWKRPELIEQQDLMQVKLILRLENVTKGEEDVLKNVLNENSETQHDTDKMNGANVLNEGGNVLKYLNERQKIVLRLLIEEPCITWSDLADRINVSSKTIQRDIEKLKKLDVVSREGGRAEGRWIVKPEHGVQGIVARRVSWVDLRLCQCARWQNLYRCE